jgi:hypothetical protein
MSASHPARACRVRRRGAGAASIGTVEVDDRMVVALEEARRAIDQQNTDLAAARGAVTALLGVAGVAATLIGGLTVSHRQSFDAWTWIAVAAFALMTALTCAVVWPYKFRFENRAGVIVEWVRDHHQDATDVRRNLALFMDENWEHNGATLWWLTMSRVPMTLLLLVEVVALLFSTKGG